MKRSERLKMEIKQAKKTMRDEHFPRESYERSVFESMIDKWTKELDAIQNGKQPDTEEPNVK